MNQLDKQKMVFDFHAATGANINSSPMFPAYNERELRISLLKEEFQEYLDAESDDNIVEVADALGDMLYIIFGTAVSYGIPLDRVFNEIHRSNMSKFDVNGIPIRREDGKILKGPNYSKPDIAAILSNNDE